MLNIDVAKFLQENNIPISVSSNDVLGNKEVKVNDILTGKTPDQKVDNMSDVFPRTNTGQNDVLS